MRRFEYRRMAYKDLIDLGRSAPANEHNEMEAMLHMGDHGWELTHILDNKSQMDVKYYFKRELLNGAQSEQIGSAI